MSEKKDESRCFTRLRRAFPRAHFQRLESWTGTGIFDTNMCQDSVESWVEAKDAGDPKRSETLIKCKVRKEQVAWEYLRRAVGGRTFVAIMVGERMFLIHGRFIGIIKQGVTRQWLEDNNLDLNVLVNPVTKN
jgi:hypothetical protein